MSRPKRIAVIAIHGVANQESGELARALALRLAEPGGGEGGQERWEIRHPSLPHDRGPLRGALEDGAHALGSAFRTAVLRDVPVDAQSPVDVHEISWADLSRPGRSPIAVLSAILGLVLALPSIGRRELVAARLPEALSQDLERATEAIKEILVPSVALGVVLMISLVALPCSSDRAETIQLVLSIVHAVAIPVVAPWFGTRLLRPRPGKQWSFGFLSTILGAAAAGATWTLPHEVLAWLPAAEIIGVGAAATWATLPRWIPTPKELARARAVVVLLVFVWIVGVMRNVVDLELGDAPTFGIALARRLVYATVFAIEFAYASTSVGFGVAAFFALRALAPYARQIVRSYGTAYQKIHVLRTAAMSHALPLVLMVFLAMPLVSGLLAALSTSDLLPRTLVRLQILRSLESFADAGPVCAPMHLRDVLVALVRGSGTHLLSLAVGSAVLILTVVTFVAVPIVRVELGAFSDPPNESSEMARQRDALASWLERGTGVIANWLRNGSLLVASLLAVGFAVEVLVWLVDWLSEWFPQLASIFDALRAMERWGRALLGRDSCVSLWDTAADSSGAIVLAMGVGLAGSTAFLALPGRVREITQPLWPVLDVILDVTRYLDSDRRTRILARGHAVFEPLLAQPYERVVVIAHSQGTLIATDLLRMTRDARASSRGSPPIHLVTLGSPLSNLYHRLLPASFAWVEDATRDPKTLGVASWTNIYGGGDAVGRTVRHTELLRRLRGLPPEVSADRPDGEDPTGWIDETNVGSLGHVSYFDPDSSAAPAIRSALRGVVLGTRNELDGELKGE